MQTKDVLLVGLEMQDSEKSDCSEVEKADDDGVTAGDTPVGPALSGPPPGLASVHPKATAQIHGAVWASCSHTPGVLIGAVVLVLLGLGAVWDAVESSIAPSQSEASSIHATSGPHSGTSGGDDSAVEQGWGWAALSELAGLDVALAIIRTDQWATGQTDTSGTNSLAAQVRFIGSDGREVRSPRVRELSTTWPDDVVGRHLVLPNSATVTTLLHTFAITGIASHQLRWLAEDCQASTRISRDLAPAYLVKSLTPSATPGQLPQLRLELPGAEHCTTCSELPMAAFSVVANREIFQEFQALVEISCFHAALVTDERNARATIAHMAYMRANTWDTSDAVFVLLCVDGWGGRVVDGICISLNGGAMDLSTKPTCRQLDKLQEAWTRLRDDASQPARVRDQLRMDEDRGQVFSEIEGLG